MPLNCLMNKVWRRNPCFDLRDAYSRVGREAKGSRTLDICFYHKQKKIDYTFSRIIVQKLWKKRGKSFAVKWAIKQSVIQTFLQYCAIHETSLMMATTHLKEEKKNKEKQKVILSQVSHPDSYWQAFEILMLPSRFKIS